MRKYLITSVSTVALLFGAASLASAQTSTSPSAQDPASPGAGAIQKEGTMQKDPAMKQRRSTETMPGTSGSSSGATGSMGSSSSMDSATYKSYSDNKDTLAGASIAGGFTADQLIGADVLNASGDSIGEIEDLVVDTNNQVSKAIVGVGGFLGMGTKNVTLDIAELKQGTDQKGFLSTMTKEELKTLPEYKKESGNWVRSESKSGGGLK